MRILVAFLVAPLIVALGWSSSIFIFLVGTEPLSELFIEYLVTNVAIYFGALTFTAVFGAPLFLLCRHFNLVGPWVAGIAGAFIGGVAGMLLGNMTTPLETVGLSLLGGLAGLIFWHVSGLSIAPQVRDTADRGK